MSGQGRRDVVAALAWVAAAMVALPMAVVLATRWGSEYFPVQDLAVVDLRLRDMFTSDMPLVGVYSQFGWNHPGPAIYVMLTPFMWIAGGEAWGMIVGSAVIQGAALTATVLVAKRSAGPLWALFWAVVCSLSYVPLGPFVLLEAWNPHLAFPLFVLFAAVSWRCSEVPGSYAGWVAVVGSLLVQLHAGYLPLVGAVAGWLVWNYWRAEAAESGRVEARSVIRQVVVSLSALWALPVIEALTNGGGNLRALADYFLFGRGEEQRAGVATAGRLLATQFRLPPPWLGGPGDKDPLTALTTGSSLAWLVVPVLLVAIGALLFRRSGRPIRSILMLSWVLLGAGVIALTFLRGKVAPYLFYWRIPVSILLVGAVLAAAWSLLGSGTRQRWSLPVACVALAAVAAPSVSFSVDVVDAPDDVMVFETIAERLAEQIDSVQQPVIVRWAGSPLSGLQAGLVNDLDRRGLPVGVDTGGGFQWGDGRELPVEEAGEVWFASEQGFVTAALERLPGASVVAAVSPLSSAEDQELGELQVEAIDELRRLGRSDVIPKLDSSLAVFDLEELDVLDEPERRRFVELSDAVAESGVYRASVVAFDPAGAPSAEELGYLAPPA